MARTVVRRAERTAWRPCERYGTLDAGVASGQDGQPGGLNLLALTYLNRLSDLLFIVARSVNGAAGDILWEPGGDRGHDHPEPPREENPA